MVPPETRAVSAWCSTRRETLMPEQQTWYVVVDGVLDNRVGYLGADENAARAIWRSSSRYKAAGETRRHDSPDAVAAERLARRSRWRGTGAHDARNAQRSATARLRHGPTLDRHRRFLHGCRQNPNMRYTQWRQHRLGRGPRRARRAARGELGALKYDLGDGIVSNQAARMGSTARSPRSCTSASPGTPGARSWRSSRIPLRFGRSLRNPPRRR
jgi:hypothetical protein